MRTKFLFTVLFFATVLSISAKEKTTLDFVKDFYPYQLSWMEKVEENGGDSIEDQADAFYIYTRLAGMGSDAVWAFIDGILPKYTEGGLPVYLDYMDRGEAFNIRVYWVPAIKELIPALRENGIIN